MSFFLFWLKARLTVITTLFVGCYIQKCKRRLSLVDVIVVGVD